MPPKFLLLIIFFLSLFLRLYRLNWDDGYHLHPDERMIVMVVDGLEFPDSLNPKFFAYGSFPLYLLKLVSLPLSLINPRFSTYDQINLVGRAISAIFDSFTVLLIIRLSYLLFSSKPLSLLSGLAYSLSFFPIQLAHFYAVDSLLNFFILLTLYHSLRFHQNHQVRHLTFSAIALGLSLSTKISATVVVLPVLISLFLSLNFNLKKLLPRLFLLVCLSGLTFFITQPFAVLDFSTFWRHINEQSAMTKNAFVFPYTLQYVNTIPYFYQLKNIFLWGFGPFISFLIVLGIINSFRRPVLSPKIVILLSFAVPYFLLTGSFAVKFMRYCLPLYPLLVLCIGNFPKKYRLLVFPTLFFHIFWLLAFFAIYRFPNTRVQATAWINQNIPSGSTILREHWDDGLPLGYTSDFRLDELALYEPDSNPQKWPKINHQLQNADYLVIASNRLYTPLQKLTDCPSLPPGKCYLQTAAYYQDLFSGKLGYQKVAEFTSYPNILGVTINDQSADESFTVYDHPRVIIFKNTNR